MSAGNVFIWVVGGCAVQQGGGWGGSVKECNAGSLGPPRVYKSALRLCQFIRT